VELVRRPNSARVAPVLFRVAFTNAPGNRRYTRDMSPRRQAELRKSRTSPLPRRFHEDPHRTAHQRRFLATRCVKPKLATILAVSIRHTCQQTRRAQHRTSSPRCAASPSAHGSAPAGTVRQDKSATPSAIATNIFSHTIQLDSNWHILRYLAQECDFRSWATWWLTCCTHHQRTLDGPSQS